MKKAIAVLIAMFMALPFAFAVQTGEGARITAYNADEGKVSSLHVILDASGSNFNEIAICVTPDKQKGYVVASMKSKDLFGYAIAKANKLLAFIRPSDLLSRHFGCVSVRI